MAALRTAFEILGVSKNPSDQEVADVYLPMEALELNGGPPVPDEVRAAWEALHCDENRKAYRELLWYCRRGRPMKVLPSRFQWFDGFCERAMVSVATDPDRPDWYYVWLPCQTPPVRLVKAQRRQMGVPEPPLTLVKATAHVFKQILFLQVFRGKSPRAKAAIAVIYLLAVVGLVQGAARVKEVMRRLDEKTIVLQREAARAALEKTLRDGCGTARVALGQVNRGVKDLESDFERAVGVPLGEAASRSVPLPRRLDNAILRDPAVSEALADTFKAPPTAAELAAAQKTLDEIGKRISQGDLQTDDKNTLADLTQWAQQKLADVQQQKPKVAQNRAAMDAEPSGRSSTTGERSSVP